jgi:hypothetical protein
MSKQADFPTLLKEFQGLEQRLEELTRRANQVKTQNPDSFEKVKHLSLNPDVSKLVAETSSHLSLVKSAAELAQALKEVTNLSSTLEAILLSPRVEEYLTVLRSPALSLELKLSADAENWFRDGLKGAAETAVDQLIGTAKLIAAEVRKENLLRDQFREWLSYKLSLLVNLKAVYASVKAWVDEIISGLNPTLELSTLLGSIKGSKSEFKKSAVLIDRFYQTSLIQLEDGFKTRIGDAPTFWRENLTTIASIWPTANQRLRRLDSLIQTLSDDEEKLLRSHIEAQAQTRLVDFSGSLDALYKILYNLAESLRNIEKITGHLDSMENVRTTDSRILQRISDLRQLLEQVPDVTSQKQLEVYQQGLSAIADKHAQWEKNLNVLVQDLAKEGNSWVQVCNKQGLSACEMKMRTLLDGMTFGKSIGEIAVVHSQLLEVYDEAKSALRKRGDPDILEGIVRLQALKGSVTLSDLEQEVRKVKPSVAREAVLAGLMELEASKLVRVDIRI